MGIVERAATEHRHENGHEPISHSAQSSSMRVALAAKFRVVVLAVLVVLNTRSTPMIDSVAKAFVATSPHHNNLLFSALTRDRSRTRIAAKSVIISFRESLRGFREHRGGDDSTPPRQGTDDGHCAMLFPLPRFAYRPRESQLCPNSFPPFP